MSLGAKSLLDSYALGLSASEYFFSIVDPLPAIAYGNPFYQHSAAFFDVPPYMPLGEIPGEAGGLEIFVGGSSLPLTLGRSIFCFFI